MMEDHKKKALDRLKRMRGQIEGVSKMVEEDAYCIDILTQIRAIEGALKGVATHILESHLHTCAGKQLASSDPAVREKFIKELVKVCDLSSR